MLSIEQVSSTRRFSTCESDSLSIRFEAYDLGNILAALRRLALRVRQLLEKVVAHALHHERRVGHAVPVAHASDSVGPGI